MTSVPVQLAIESIDFFMRNVRMRLPFRYGKACLVASPLLHTRLVARGVNGTQVTGTSADMLPPKWFDKNPAKTFEDNINDLIASARIARQHFLDAGTEAKTVFGLWHLGYQNHAYAAHVQGLNGLTSGFGASLVERALMDAACRLEKCDFFTMVRENRFGIDPGAVHEELAGMQPADALDAAPLDHVHVRHTVGLGDPLSAGDLAAGERLDDGLPQTLEDWAREAGVRYFKIKVQGDLTRDLPRLEQIAAVLAQCAPEDYQITLDGNEQFETAELFAEWLDAVKAAPVWKQIGERILFVEQPIDRAMALTAPLPRRVRESAPPCIIDESDDHLDAFKLSVDYGYRGTSVKNCKGVTHALLNKLLIARQNAAAGGGFLLSSEDLCNQPLVPLQQDCCTLSVLGVRHAERNGHHYVGTLDHVPEAELETALRDHPTLYEPFGNSARLTIRDGRIDLRSLRQPGYGAAMLPDFESMTPVTQWAYASLGIE